MRTYWTKARLFKKAIEEHWRRRRWVPLRPINVQALASRMKNLYPAYLPRYGPLTEQPQQFRGRATCRLVPMTPWTSTIILGRPSFQAYSTQAWRTFQRLRCILAPKTSSPRSRLLPFHRRLSHLAPFYLLLFRCIVCREDMGCLPQLDAKDRKH